MTMDGDGSNRTPGKHQRKAAPGSLEVVKRRDPLSLQDQTLYLSLVDELTNEKQPSNLCETKLVEEIARSYVRLQRARRLETETLDKYIFEVQSRFPKPLEADKALSIVFMEHGAQLESMQRRELKIEDAWYRVMTELDHEQTARRAREPEPAVLADPKSNRIHLVRNQKQD